MIKLLLKYGAYIDLPNNDKNVLQDPNQTPLEIAIEKEDQSMVDLLLKSSNFVP